MMTLSFVPMTVALVGVLGCALSAGAPKTALAERPSAWTVADLYASPRPYAQGHRGYGSDLFAPSPPVENTLEAFREAFEDGIRVVELDLQRTADGKIVVFHDEFLSDFTCISSLTYDQLHERRPSVPLFGAVLNASRHFGYADCLNGVIFAEIKVPVPLCDGANTSEQAQVSESELVAAVVAEIRQARMEDQVIVNCGSPSILRHAMLQAPEIRRSLTLNALQLLTPAQACAVLPPSLCPVLIPKSDADLEWYNIGPIARLPRYLSFQHFVGVTLGHCGATGVSLDRLVLLQAGAAAPGLVAALHGAGLEVVVWTVDTASEWSAVAAAGVDGITTNHIALGLAQQTSLSDCGVGVANGRSARRAEAVPDGSEPRLALAATGSNPSRGGALRVAFVLPDGGSAHLQAVDVAGREVESREVGAFGPGRHELNLGRNLPAGVYLVRLSHAQGEARIKATVVR